MLKINRKVLATILSFSIVWEMINVSPIKVHADEHKSDIIIVSMGDSYSSGEGLGNYGNSKTIEEKVNDEDWLAHRSKNAWSGQLYLKDANGNDVIMSENTNHWYFVAASGAQTKDISSPQEISYNKSVGKDTIHLRPQIDVFEELKKVEKKADFVTLTIGGNDLGFSCIAEDILDPRNILDFGKFNKDIKNAYNKIESTGETSVNLENVYRIIDEASEDAKILVAGYPRLYDGELAKYIVPGIGVTSLRSIFVYRAEIVNNAVSDLNKRIEEIANKFDDIYYVSVEEQFNNHGAGAAEQYIEYFKFHNEDDIDDTYIVSGKTMHPNMKGAEVYRQCVQEKINMLNTNPIVTFSREDMEKAYIDTILNFEKEHKDLNNKNFSYSLVYIDNDDIPELICGINSYYTEIYTYYGENVEHIFDFGYGVGGNVGCSTNEKSGYISWDDSDLAGAIHYTGIYKMACGSVEKAYDLCITQFDYKKYGYEWDANTDYKEEHYYKINKDSDLDNAVEIDKKEYDDLLKCGALWLVGDTSKRDIFKVLNYSNYYGDFDDWESVFSEQVNEFLNEFPSYNNCLETASIDINDDSIPDVLTITGHRSSDTQDGPNLIRRSYFYDSGNISETTDSIDYVGIYDRNKAYVNNNNIIVVCDGPETGQASLYVYAVNENDVKCIKSYTIAKKITDDGSTFATYDCSLDYYINNRSTAEDLEISIESMVDTIYQYGFDIYPEFIDYYCIINVNTEGTSVKDFYDVAIINNY